MGDDNQVFPEQAEPPPRPQKMGAAAVSLQNVQPNIAGGMAPPAYGMGMMPPPQRRGMSNGGRVCAAICIVFALLIGIPLVIIISIVCCVYCTANDAQPAQKAF